MASTASAPTKTIALILASTRTPRLGPSIASHALRALTAAAGPHDLSLELLDLQAHPLPLFDEPTVPAWHPSSDPTPHYVQPHARAWSATVRRFAGVVFVTPQYNWSLPASLKNALDYLYHEWGGKPVGIVSYGAHGGDKAAAHLRVVAGALHAKVLETGVQVSVPGAVLKGLAGGGGVDEGAVERAWEECGGEEKVRQMVEEMVKVLEEGEVDGGKG